MKCLFFALVCYVRDILYIRNTLYIIVIIVIVEEGDNRAQSLAGTPLAGRRRQLRSNAR